MTNRLHASRLFVIGLGAGAIIMLLIGNLAPVVADHLSQPCGVNVGWAEITKENPNTAEDGVKGDVKVNYPDGGPVDAFTRAVWIFLDEDNYGEAGWNWHDCCHSDPRAFWGREDLGIYGQDADAGDGGTRGNYQDYKVDNTTGDTWVAVKDGNQYHSYTYSNMSHGKPLTLTEVDSPCDSAEAYFRNLRDAQTNSSDYTNWSDQRESGIGTDNPCFVTDILSNTALDVNHSSC